MLELLLMLTAIALLDSLSMIPLAILPMAAALGGRRPLTSAAGFIGGMYAAYFASGVLMLAGMDALYDRFGSYLSRLWNQPNALELSVQIVIGILLVVSAWYLRRPTRHRPPPKQVPSASPAALFVLGATLIFVGIPGAVPYAAAVERIVRYDPGWLKAGACLLYYNICFVAPFLALVALRVALPGHSDRCFKAIARFTAAAMPKVVAALFFALGLVLVADGIGWFLGYPLLPVSESW